MLLERDVELGLLGGIVDRLDATGGKVVLIRGEAGIGKTSLVNAFAESRASTSHVRIGACDDLIIPQPLGPFWDIARAEPTLRGPLDDGDRPHLLETVLTLLSRPARPTILIFEDTHWADEATLDAIRFLGRRIARANGILVLTYRDGEVDNDHPLRGVIGDIPAQNLARIQLGGLSLAAVSSMVGDSGLDPVEMLAATRGNPFLVTEMSSAADDGIPASLNDSVMARVRKLSIGAQEMHRTLSVIPEPIPRIDALRLVAASDDRLEECVQRGLLDPGIEMIEFRHELIRRAVEAAMSPGERLSKNRAVLEALPEDTHSSLLVHCAVAANDVDRLIRLAPISARYAASVGSHIQAAWDFRELGPHLGRIGPEDLGPLLDEWATEEFLVDNVGEAVRLNVLSIGHYRAAGDGRAESRALAHGAHYLENAGQRERAESFARSAIEVLGPDPDGADLANALEVNAYLQMMAGNVAAVPELVERALKAGGPDIDKVILIRALNHSAIVGNITNYPAGRANLDHVRERAEANGQWYEECRALLNHAWAAAEARDLPIASDYAQRAIASAVRRQLRSIEVYSKGIYARVLDLRGDWDEATDTARELLDAAPITQMVALPVVGIIEARRGRPAAWTALDQAWQMAARADEFQRLA
ncbi:MAG: AAA family ATPase, partial [Chloroflexi bacterium]|nr:AAA family ATPase [Chloroflexota bacterium]